MEQLLEKISGDGEYDKMELSLVTQGIVVMMFGIWVQIHLNPGPNDYELNTRTVRLFLGRVFPNTDIPD